MLVLMPAFTTITPYQACAQTPARDETGWRSLFDGGDLAGWHVKCKPQDADLGFWKVEDDCIVADSLDHEGHDYVWLLTDEEYSDFQLRLQFQAFRGSPGNSGVQLRSRYDDEAGWLDGPQVDINPPGPWRTGMIWDETRGNQRWLYPDIPAGEWVDESMAVQGLAFHYADDDPAWNDLEISARGMELRAALNGVTVMEYDGTGVLDDETHRGRGVGERGFIALQIHTGDQLHIRFRNIEIRDLADHSDG